MKIIPLSISRDRMDRHDDVCSTELFEQVASAYPDKVRYEIANMAAHNWDVIEIDERIFIGGASRGVFYSRDGSAQKATKEQMDQFYPLVAKDDYKTSSQTIWVGNKKTLRRNEIQLAWLGTAGKRFMAVEEIMRKYRSDTKDMNSKRVSGEYWEEERRVQNYKNRCKRFRELTTATINQLFPD